MKGLLQKLSSILSINKQQDFQNIVFPIYYAQKLRAKLHSVTYPDSEESSAAQFKVYTSLPL